MDPTPLIPNDIREVEKCPLRDSILVFFAAVGSTICYTSVLSNLVFYTLTMGAESYLILNVSIFGPMLPISIAQTIWDTKYDREIGSLFAYTFRGTLGFGTSFLCLLAMPYVQSVFLLSISTLFLGLASAILQGMLKQMASFTYPGCGRLAAAVAAGMQASSLPVLCASLGFGFGRDSRSDSIRGYYYFIVMVLSFCWMCFQIMLRTSAGVSKGMKRKDSYNMLMENGGIQNDQPTHFRGSDDLQTDNYQNSQSYPEDGEELSLSKLWQNTRPACFVLMITVASSMSVACWLNNVKSQYEDNQAFAQDLFYVRLFADLLGRPATLFFPVSSIYTLIPAACIRFVFVPIFFLYTMSDIIPKSDIATVVGMFVFAFTSGYLATLSYQLAPLLLDEQKRELNLARQTGLINISFSASIWLGFGLTFLVETIVYAV